jgi:hypothetical protein
MPSTPSPYLLRAHAHSHHGHKGTHLVSMEGTAAVTAAAEAARDSGEVRAVEAATADSGEAMLAATDSEVEAEWPARTSGSPARSVCCSMSPDIPSHRCSSRQIASCHGPRSPPVSLHRHHSRCRYRRPTARRRRRSSSLGSRSASACSPHYRRHWRRTATSPTAPATPRRSSPSRSPPLRSPQRSRSAAPPSWQS